MGAREVKILRIMRHENIVQLKEVPLSLSLRNVTGEFGVSGSKRPPARCESEEPLGSPFTACRLIPSNVLVAVLCAWGRQGSPGEGGKSLD